MSTLTKPKEMKRVSLRDLILGTRDITKVQIMLALILNTERSLLTLFTQRSMAELLEMLSATAGSSLSLAQATLNTRTNIGSKHC